MLFMIPFTVCNQRIYRFAYALEIDAAPILYLVPHFPEQVGYVWPTLTCVQLRAIQLA